MFFVHQRGTANGIYFAAVMAGTFITPMAAGSQAVATGWRSSYATLAAVMTAMSGLFAIAFEETKYVPVIQGAMSSDHAAVYDPELGPKDAKYAPSIRSMHIVNPPAPRRSFPRNMRLQLITKTDESLLKTFFSPLSVWWFPHVLFTSFQIASGICWLTIVGSFNTIIFSEPPYNFSPAQIGFLAGGPCVGTIFGSLYGGLLTDKAIVWLSKRNGGVFDPEMRLYMYPLPAIGMAAGFVIYCITADRVRGGYNPPPPPPRPLPSPRARANVAPGNALDLSQHRRRHLRLWPGLHLRHCLYPIARLLSQRECMPCPLGAGAAGLTPHRSSGKPLLSSPSSATPSASSVPFPSPPGWK